MEKATKSGEPQIKIDFSLEPALSIRSKSFDMLSSGEDKKHIFRKLGYEILESGDLIDSKTKKEIKVFGKENEVVNLNLFPKVALVSGSHHFIRNLAEYSELLADRGELNLIPSTKISIEN